MKKKRIAEGQTIAQAQNSTVIEARDIFNQILGAIGGIMEDIRNIKGYGFEMEEEKNEIVGILEILAVSTEENSAATE